MTVTNLFDDLRARADGENFTEIMSREGVCIERIVSSGQSTPPDKPHRQTHDEWVVLLARSAGLRIGVLSRPTSTHHGQNLFNKRIGKGARA
jgi:hypothetical protein